MLFRSALFFSPLFLCSSAALFGASDTVAVLPFFNHSGNANLEWIGESVAETLRESLSSAGVIALTREERIEVYRRLSVRSEVTLTRATVMRIGESLDASQVVYGTYELTPPPPGDTSSRGQLKIDAELIDLKRLHSGPRFFETGRLEDLSLMESRLAWQAMKFLLPKSSPSEEEFLRDRPPVRIDAVESYVRGLLSTSMDQKLKLFQQSAKLDTRYSEPAYQLGRITFDRKDYRNAAGWLEKVTPTDSHYHKSQFLLGLCDYYAGQYDAAVKILSQVAAAVPLNEVFNNLGIAEAHRSKAPEAIEALKKAVEGDETDPDFWFNLGYEQWRTGQAADAAKSFRAVLDRTPEDEEAVTLLERAQRGDLPHTGEALNGERVKKQFEEMVFLQLKAELKK